VIDDGRLLVVLATLGLTAGATALAGSRGVVRAGRATQAFFWERNRGELRLLEPFGTYTVARSPTHPGWNVTLVHPWGERTAVRPARTPSDLVLFPTEKAARAAAEAHAREARQGSRATVREGRSRSLPVFWWDEPTEADTFPADPDGWADAKGVVLDEYQLYLGKIGLTYSLSGYINESDSVNLDNLDPPVRVRVLPTDRASLLHENDGYIDPYWNVEVLDPVYVGERLLKGLRSTWIYGKSVLVMGKRDE
jgi:hypothetical protein